MLLATTLLLVATSALAEYSHHYNHYPSEHESHSYDHDHEKKYHGPPAPLKHDGTVDYTPEVKHARAAHFAALDAYKQSFPYGHHQYHASPAHVPYAHFYNHNPAPVKHDGSVDDLPEVKAARAAHLSEYAKVLYQRHKRSISHGAPLNHDGTVAETPEVQHAKAVHFAAIAEARSYSDAHDAPHYYHESAPEYSHGGYKKYVEPAPLNHDGTVADTEDVKHAKAILYKAHNEAKARLHHSSPHYTVHQYPSHQEHSDQSYSKKYHGPPAPLNHDGTVAETPDVKHAKAVHFHLYNQALHRYRRGVHFQPAPLNHDGTVAETPEVQKATQAFLAAHAAESAQADHSWVEPEHYDEPKYQNHVGLHYQHTTPSFYSAPQSKPIFEEQAHQFAPLQHYSKHYEPAPLNHDGTVADTPAIKAAKAVHFAAYQQSKVHSYPVHSAPAPFHSTSSSPSHYSHYKKPVIPAPLNHDGTVAETPEIRAAKAIHFAAHQEAHSRIVPHKYSYPHY